MDETDDIHSVYGGSIASRWLNCAGSVALCATVPKLPASRWAEEGTVAHGLGAYCLTNGLHNVFAGMDDPRGYPDDMAAAVQVYLDAVYAELARTPDAQLYVEQKFAYRNVGDGKEVFGRNDALVYHPSIGRLVVFEYKHGAGVYVPVEDNDQLKFYAAGAVLANPEWRLAEVILVVVQPRFWSAGETQAVHEWPLDIVELFDFASVVDRGVKAAKAPDAPLTTGAWCRWCDAAAICPAREHEVLEAGKLPFAGMDKITMDDLPDVHSLDVERIAEVMRGLALIETWASQVRDFAEAHMVAGTLEIPGWKVVDKLGRRAWVSADREVAGYLQLLYGVTEDEIRPRRLVTLGDAEKILKGVGLTKDEREQVFAKFTVKQSSGQTIAPTSDKRDAVDPARDFAGVNITV